jgi:hypothetical protein
MFNLSFLLALFLFKVVKVLAQSVAPNLDGQKLDMDFKF